MSGLARTHSVATVEVDHGALAGEVLQRDFFSSWSRSVKAGAFAPGSSRVMALLGSWSC